MYRLNDHEYHGIHFDLPGMKENDAQENLLIHLIYQHSPAWPHVLLSYMPPGMQLDMKNTHVNTRFMFPTIRVCYVVHRTACHAMLF